MSPVRQGYGIYLRGGECRGNVILRNTVSRALTNGMWIRDADANRIEGNHVSDTQPVAVGATWGIETTGSTGKPRHQKHLRWSGKQFFTVGE